jgi:hypothetical protein
LQKLGGLQRRFTESLLFAASRRESRRILVTRKSVLPDLVGRWALEPYVIGPVWFGNERAEWPRIKLADIRAWVQAETSRRNLVVNATVDHVQSTIRPNRVSAFTQVTIS